MSVYESEAFDLREPTPEGIRRGGYIRIQTVAAPEIRMISHSQIVLEEAVDEAGNSLVPAVAGQSRIVSTRTAGDERIVLSVTDVPIPPIVSTAHRWILTAWLHYPENVGKRVARLRGHFPVVIQSKSALLKFEDVLDARDQSFVAGAYRYVLKGVQKLNDIEYQADVEVHPRAELPADTDFFWRDSWVELMLRLPDARMVDTRGHSFAPPRVTRTGYGRTFMTGRMIFSRRDHVDEPATLLWEVPEETQEILISFEFTDLPRP